MVFRNTSQYVSELSDMNSQHSATCSHMQGRHGTILGSGKKKVTAEQHNLVRDAMKMFKWTLPKPTGNQKPGDRVQLTEEGRADKRTIFGKIAVMI